MLPRHPQRQAVTDFRQDVLSQHSPPRANSPGKPDSIIALTRTDISDGHTRSDPCAIHDVVGFVQPVAAFLVRPARGFDMGYRPVCTYRKSTRMNFSH